MTLEKFAWEILGPAERQTGILRWAELYVFSAHLDEDASFTNQPQSIAAVEEFRVASQGAALEYVLQRNNLRKARNQLVEQDAPDYARYQNLTMALNCAAAEPSPSDSFLLIVAYRGFLHRRDLQEAVDAYLRWVARTSKVPTANERAFAQLVDWRFEPLTFAEVDRLLVLLDFMPAALAMERLILEADSVATF